MLDPIAALAFSLYENKGVYALLLGSGLSSAAQIPTGWEITLDLVRRAALIQGIEDQDDWAGWYRKNPAENPNTLVYLMFSRRRLMNADQSCTAISKPLPTISSKIGRCRPRHIGPSHSW